MVVTVAATLSSCLSLSPCDDGLPVFGLFVMEVVVTALQPCAERLLPHTDYTPIEWKYDSLPVLGCLYQCHLFSMRCIDWPVDELN
jgi:hypothetical protein